ncbi:hypothetical protein V6N12_031420 [Hibiscus sabdariffa]|uniref:Uncharacterized protein n=1 Tax=Hibiscus sabdariffa TaxID=183260 RepID=A0ABR2B3P4_9ROSI
MSQVDISGSQSTCVLPVSTQGVTSDSSTLPPEHIDASSSPSLADQPIDHENADIEPELVTSEVCLNSDNQAVSAAAGSTAVSEMVPTAENGSVQREEPVVSGHSAPVPESSVTNTHRMVTRSKVGYNDAQLVMAVKAMNMRRGVVGVRMRVKGGFDCYFAALLTQVSIVSAESALETLLRKNYPSPPEPYRSPFGLFDVLEHFSGSCEPFITGKDPDPAPACCEVLEILLGDILQGPKNLQICDLDFGPGDKFLQDSCMVFQPR